MDEWKYTGGTLYFSIYGLAVDCQGHVGARAAAATAAAAAAAAAANDVSQTSFGGVSGDQSLSYLLHPAPAAAPAPGPTASFLQGGPPAPPPSLPALLLLATHDAAAYQHDGAKARHEVFQDAYRDVDGAGLSLRERARLALDEPSFSYGEVEYVSFQQLLRDAGACDGQVFYDLGSGVGKVGIQSSPSS
jgi:hypothetical protein